MNITAVVVVYNTCLVKSDTLNSLINCTLHDITLEICVWNNGPAQLAEDDINRFLHACNEKKITTKIYQDTRNISLAKIYNFFTSNNFDFISILDQDSQLPSNFIENIRGNEGFDIILPKLMADSSEIKQYYPHLASDPKIMIEEGRIVEPVMSAMSGVTISKNAAIKIIETRGYVFEDRLAFYGIDNDFFRCCNMMTDCKLSMLCSNEIVHSLSTLDSKEASSEFRIQEIYYFKYFIRNEYQKKNKISTIYVTLRDFFRGKMPFQRMTNLILFTFNNAHPRSKFDIPKKTQPTHAN